MAQKKVLVLDTNKNQINPAQDETIVLLRKIVQLLQSNATIDTKQRQKVIIDAVGTIVATGLTTEVTTAIPVSGTVSANSTPVASAVNMGNVTVQFGPQATATAAGLDSRFLLIDTARNAYANGIRSKITY